MYVLSGKTDAVSSPEICRVNIPPKRFYSNSEVIQELDDSYTLSHTESTPTQSQSSNPSVPSSQFTQPSSDSVFTELQPATIQEVKSLLNSQESSWDTHVYFNEPLVKTTMNFSFETSFDELTGKNVNNKQRKRAPQSENFFYKKYNCPTSGTDFFTINN